MTNPPLPVLFRKSGEDVIAVFPTLPADYTGNTMVCYMHVGQHGACSIGFYLDSKPAYPHEYDDLLFRSGVEEVAHGSKTLAGTDGGIKIPM